MQCLNTDISNLPTALQILTKALYPGSPASLETTFHLCWLWWPGSRAGVPSPGWPGRGAEGVSVAGLAAGFLGLAAGFSSLGLDL